MFTFADEKKVTDRLPKYVADSPDAMPYLRMVDSDFKLLLGSMDKMQVMIDHVMGAVQTMHTCKFMHEQMTGYNTSNRAAGSTVIGTAGLLNTLQSATVSTAPMQLSVIIYQLQTAGHRSFNQLMNVQ